jgi:hypothetical protein
MELQDEVFNKAYEIIAQLPRYHHDTLIALLKFLNKVSTYSSQNLMTTKNLALV